MTGHLPDRRTQQRPQQRSRQRSRQATGQEPGHAAEGADLDEIRLGLQVAIEQYRASVADINRLSMIALPHIVWPAYPRASHVIVEDSDQGDWLSFNAIVLRPGPTSSTPEALKVDDIGSIAEDLDAVLNDVFNDDKWLRQWTCFASTGPDAPHVGAGEHALDLDLILHCGGDYRLEAALHTDHHQPGTEAGTHP